MNDILLGEFSGLTPLPFQFTTKSLENKNNEIWNYKRLTVFVDFNNYLHVLIWFGSDMVVMFCVPLQEAVRNSVCHSATVMSNSFMHCGTTCDQFLR